MIKEFDKTALLRLVEACNSRNLDLVDRLTDEIFTEDLIQHVPDVSGLTQGIEGQKALMRETISKNPDFHITIHEILSDGDKVIGRGTWQLNNPTTGAVESFVWLEIDRLFDGKIAEVWNLMVPGNW